MSRCFVREEETLGYRHWLGEALADADCALHACVLMTNPMHLLLTPRKAEAVPRLLTSLGRRSLHYANRSYRRTGTLRDSRSESSSIQAQTHLLVCQRYIELNPVRAAMVEEAAQYRWSGYRANALKQSEGLITPHPIYEAMGRGAEDFLE